MMAMKERTKTKREDMCHCLKTIQVSSICVFLYIYGDDRLVKRMYGTINTAGGDGKGSGDTTLKLVRTIACALNKLDPCPYRHVRRGRDPLLLLQSYNKIKGGGNNASKPVLVVKLETKRWVR